MSRDERRTLSKPVSILLDAMRFSAALVVLIGHLTQPLFSTGWPDLTEFGIAAVGVFFVLSGLVIGYTRPRHPDGLDYARARLVRLWSVVIPALVFTACADLIGRTLDPAVYANWTQPPARGGAYFLADALFLNQSWNHELAFGSINPIWSLGYEAGYYALFGAAIYLRGLWRILVILLLLAIKGPQILVLLPVWLLGVATCAFVLDPKKRLPGLALSLVGALAVWLARPLHIDHLLARIPGGVGVHDNFSLLLGMGFLTSSLILAASILEPVWGALAVRLGGIIRWLAGATFTIYLFHFPLLVLIQALTRYPRSSTVVKLAVLAGVLLFCFAVSLVTERRKEVWDGPVRRLLAAATSFRRSGKAEAPAAGDAAL